MTRAMTQAMTMFLTLTHTMTHAVTLNKTLNPNPLKLSLHREKHRSNTDFLRNDRDVVVEMR